MVTKEEILEIIKEKKQVVYTTVYPGKHAHGERTGNPHILFQTKKGEITLDIWKLDGVQTKTGELPGWRSYHLSDIETVKPTGETFRVEGTFNPASRSYHRIIGMVGR